MMTSRPLGSVYADGSTVYVVTEYGPRAVGGVLGRALMASQSRSLWARALPWALLAVALAVTAPGC
jgi:hypothetical protein